MMSYLEVMREALATLVQGEAQGGVVVGPATQEQLKAGVISLSSQGLAVSEPNLPILRARVTVRCLGPTIDVVARIADAVIAGLKTFSRVAVLQPSTGERFLVHSIVLSGGPALARDSETTWEVLLYLDTIIGEEAL